VDGGEVMAGPGEEELWLWFCLSYATWLTLPRVMMHEMSDEWQGKMAALLNEWTATYQNMPDIGTRVCITKHGKFCKKPEWLSYRHPDTATIRSFK